MAKTKAGDKEVPVEVKPFEITQAAISDDLCNYSFEITDGVGIGDTHSVKGKGLIEDDLRDAFRSLNVHLAIIDDVYEHSDIAVANPLDLTNHELTALFHVNGFAIKGSKEDESVIMTGTKYVGSAASRLEIKTPKISLGEFSGYKFAKQLKAALDVARNEVGLYKGGKCTLQEPAEPENPNQGKIKFNAPEFEEAKV